MAASAGVIRTNRAREMVEQFFRASLICDGTLARDRSIHLRVILLTSSVGGARFLNCGPG
jgi:hypothetical protein